jgi:hypothetical protein
VLMTVSFLKPTRLLLLVYFCMGTFAQINCPEGSFMLGLSTIWAQVG